MSTDHTNITCPDCRGSLHRIHDGDLLQYQCRVGHTYSPQSAVAAHALTEENTLWAAVVALDEGADLAEEVAGFVDGEAGERLKKHAQLKRRLGQRVKELLEELQSPKLV